MCPIMSFVAACLFKGVDVNLFTKWIALTAHNLPMAFFWQFCYAGPFVRFIFHLIFDDQKADIAVGELEA